MGTMICTLGLALLEPQAAPAIIAAVTLFAAHHGLTKGALFLGVGVVKSSPSRWAFPFLAFPALALAGMPFTSGALAKDLLSLSVFEVAGTWSWVFFWMLSVAAVGMSLLMASFLYIMRQLTGRQQTFDLAPALPWLGLLTVILFIPLSYDGVSSLTKNSWPIIAAAAIAILVIWTRPRILVSLVGLTPPGDIIGPFSGLANRLVAAYRLSRNGCLADGTADRSTSPVTTSQLAWSVASNLREKVRNCLI